MKICMSSGAGNPAEDLPLFAWSAGTRHRRPSIPFAASWLRRRHPLSPARAALVAMLAGLNVSGGV
jgi:hypothetical protein